MNSFNPELVNLCAVSQDVEMFNSTTSPIAVLLQGIEKEAGEAGLKPETHDYLIQPTYPVGYTPSEIGESGFWGVRETVFKDAENKSYLASLSVGTGIVFQELLPVCGASFDVSKFLLEHGATPSYWLERKGTPRSNDSLEVLADISAVPASVIRSLFCRCNSTFSGYSKGTQDKIFDGSRDLYVTNPKFLYITDEGTGRQNEVFACVLRIDLESSRYASTGAVFLLR